MEYRKAEEEYWTIELFVASEFGVLLDNFLT